MQLCGWSHCDHPAGNRVQVFIQVSLPNNPFIVTWSPVFTLSWWSCPLPYYENPSNQKCSSAFPPLLPSLPRHHPSAFLWPGWTVQAPVKNHSFNLCTEFTTSYLLLRISPTAVLPSLSFTASVMQFPLDCYQLLNTHIVSSPFWNT